jgi:hypothetical protein
MAEQELHLLGLYIIWKARSLPDVKDSSEEEEPTPTAKDGKGKGKTSTKTSAKSSVTPGAFLSASTTLMPTLARRPSPDEIVTQARIPIHGDGIDVFARDSCRSGALQA